MQNRKGDRRKGQKTQTTKNPFEFIRYSSFRDEEEAITKLIKDLKRFKLHFPEDFREDFLIEGYGEAVCFIVNDLTNRELIRRKFSFVAPNLHSSDS